MTITHRTIDTSLGELTLVADGDALAGIYYPGHWTKPDRDAWGPRAEGTMQDAERQLREYLAGERTTFAVATAAHGDPFQESVWEVLRAIPYGETTTYGAIAAQLGRGPEAARAVGSAVGRNPLSIIVPCHRVIGSDGSLTGYAGGLNRKRALLELEGAAVVATEQLELI